MKKYKLVRGGVFDKTWMELYRHEGEIVFWYSDDDSPYDYYQDSGMLPCGCCSCCGCDCWDGGGYEWEDDDYEIYTDEEVRGDKANEVPEIDEGDGWE